MFIIISMKLYCINTYICIMAVNHEESQNDSKSAPALCFKIYAKLPLQIEVALSAFHIFIVRTHSCEHLLSETQYALQAK